MNKILMTILALIALGAGFVTNQSLNEFAKTMNQINTANASTIK